MQLYVYILMHLIAFIVLQISAVQFMSLCQWKLFHVHIDTYTRKLAAFRLRVVVKICWLIFHQFSLYENFVNKYFTP